MALYAYFRWIVLVGKILGCFPMQNILTKNPFNLRYRVFSFDVLYSVTIHLVVVGTQYWKHGFQFCTDTRFQQLLEVLVLFMYIRTGFSFLFCIFRHVPKSIQLIRLLEIFAEQRERSLNLKKPGLSRKMILCVSLFISVVLSGIYAVQSCHLIREIYSNTDDYWSAISFAFSCVWQITPPMYFVVFSSKIIYGFDEINQALISKGYHASYCKEYEKILDDPDYLSRLRILHNLLSEATHALSVCYGGYVAVQKLFLIVAVVINISAYITSTRDPHLLVLTSIDIFYFTVMVNLSYSIIKKGAKVARLFQGIPLSTLSEKSRNEVQLWLLQLSVHPVHVNAAGYFILDKTQTFEVLSSIATYLIVAVQLLEDQKTTV
ncbi:uncharacterized protein LOC115889983 isoform X4 [Sitophilus oryzae]|uniref:Gustatory receptor n=1 Tax=Sitophilus oryzae TaxID=7048 RepID=A0A6J2YRN2_SITOR|nr:uncharacterized protein LOC115889983 isoform X4 [Sitophilus oryzae]